VPVHVRVDEVLRRPGEEADGLPEVVPVAGASSSITSLRMNVGFGPDPETVIFVRSVP